MIERWPPRARSSREDRTVGSLVPQTLERPLRPGEVSASTSLSVHSAKPRVPICRVGDQSETAAPRPSTRRAPDGRAQELRRRRQARDAKIANQSIRVHVDTLEHLMTMVSELVLTRNQLIELVRRHEEPNSRAAAAALERHRRAAGRRAENAHAADRQCLAEAAASRARPGRRARRDIELEMHGAETELDRQVLDLIKDPLTHMVAQRRGPRAGNAGAAARRPQARERDDPPVRRSRRRPHHHRDHRRRTRARHGAHQAKAVAGLVYRNPKSTS